MGVTASLNGSRISASSQSVTGRQSRGPIDYDTAVDNYPRKHAAARSTVLRDLLEKSLQNAWQGTR